jgi:hypothetical protein
MMAWLLEWWGVGTCGGSQGTVGFGTIDVNSNRSRFWRDKEK